MTRLSLDKMASSSSYFKFERILKKKWLKQKPIRDTVVHGLEVPQQNTTNTLRGRFPNSFVGESLSIIQFLLVFCLVADVYIHTQKSHTRLWAQSINIASTSWPRGTTILPSILWSIHIPIHSSNYNTTRVYKLKQTSVFFLFCFFERNQEETTAFENCSCLATWCYMFKSRLT